MKGWVRPHPFFVGLWVALAMSFLTGIAQIAYAQEPSAEVQRTVWDGVYTGAQAERGQVLYTESCAGCHSDDLRGDNQSPALVWVCFTFLWGGFTLGELFRSIQEQMPTDRPGSLPDQTYRDVVAFVLSKNGYPAGEKELGDDYLDQILISAEPGAGR